MDRLNSAFEQKSIKPLFWRGVFWSSRINSRRTRWSAVTALGLLFDVFLIPPAREIS